MLLDVRSVTAAYGDILAVEDVSFDIPSGTIFALLGANGAGKSTTIMAIAGHVRPRSGQIRFQGSDIAGLPATARSAMGIALVPEGRRLFPDLSVSENLIVGGYSRPRGEESARIDEVTGYFPRLAERYHQTAGSLSGGEQQMLAMARALMSAPRLLLIDELSLGLMPKVVDDCYDVISRLQETGLTILLVEQNTERALSVADNVCVLESGRITWQGTAADARRDESLVEAYLGLTAV